MAPIFSLASGFLLAVRTAAHGTLTKPVTRNRGPLHQKAPPDFDAGNGGGSFTPHYNGGAGHSPCGDGLWGYSNNHGGGGVGWHYRGGDAADAKLHDSYKKLLKEYNPELNEDWRQLYVVGETIDVQAEITAYHGGHMTFHLCEVKEGEVDFDALECGVLAEQGTAEFEKNRVHPTAGSSDRLPPANEYCTNCFDQPANVVCGFDPGCFGYGPDPHYSGNHFSSFEFTLEAPTKPMDHAVLVWHWFTDNNGEGFQGNGEEFMNCADVRIVGPAQPMPAPDVTPTPPPTNSPVTAPTPAPTLTPPSPTPAPTNPPPSPTPSPPSPTPAPNGGHTCHKNPNYPNNPASEKECMSCGPPEYYQWWPCNEVHRGYHMCIGDCGRSSLAEVHSHVAAATAPKRRLKVRRQRNVDSDETAYMQRLKPKSGDSLEEDFEDEELKIDESSVDAFNDEL